MQEISNPHWLATMVGTLERWSGGVHRRMDEGGEVANLFTDLLDPTRYDRDTVEWAETFLELDPYYAKVRDLIQHIVEVGSAEASPQLAGMLGG